MRKESTFNQDLDENLICKSLEFFALQKIGMTGLLYLLMSTTVYAVCTPSPDCASIGYTETSCEGDALKCPFDTSKLYCVPCDSSYKYDCSGDNITGGVGSACGGKYVSCQCSGSATFDNGNCIEDCSSTACTVGAIYYADGTCSACVDGSKTAIGIVVKDNELVLSQKSSSDMTWGTYGKDLSLNNLTEDQARNDFNGKSNTATIIAEDSGAVAAKYCNDYTTAGTSAGDWYLPAAGELYSYVYGNYSAINTTMTKLGWSWGGSCYRWSSYEINGNYAWTVCSRNGNMYAIYKVSTYYVSCFLEI